MADSRDEKIERFRRSLEDEGYHSCVAFGNGSINPTVSGYHSGSQNTGGIHAPDLSGSMVKLGDACAETGGSLTALQENLKPFEKALAEEKPKPVHQAGHYAAIDARRGLKKRKGWLRRLLHL